MAEAERLTALSSRVKATVTWSLNKAAHMETREVSCMDQKREISYGIVVLASSFTALMVIMVLLSNASHYLISTRCLELLKFLFIFSRVMMCSHFTSTIFQAMEHF